MRDLRFEELEHVYGGGGQQNCGGTRQQNGSKKNGTKQQNFSKNFHGTQQHQEKKDNRCN
jgi:hypothetical protein